MKRQQILSAVTLLLLFTFATSPVALAAKPPKNPPQTPGTLVAGTAVPGQLMLGSDGHLYDVDGNGTRTQIDPELEEAMKAAMKAGQNPQVTRQEFERRMIEADANIVKIGDLEGKLAAAEAKATAAEGRAQAANDERDKFRDELIGKNRTLDAKVKELQPEADKVAGLNAKVKSLTGELTTAQTTEKNLRVNLKPCIEEVKRQTAELERWQAPIPASTVTPTTASAKPATP